MADTPAPPAPPAAPPARPPRPPEPKFSQPAPLHDLKGKVAYVTASSDGIGLGIARAAANAGMKVCIGYRNEERLKAALPLFKKGSAVLPVKHDVTDPGLRAMVASLVVFLPGATLTTAVLELAAGQMISGSARLVSGVMQLALLTFGILAGIEAVGISSARVFADSPDLLGDWAPWLGVLVFAGGVTVAYSAPVRKPFASRKATTWTRTTRAPIA